MTMHKVAILWGEAPDKDDEPEIYEFSTGAEATAFLQGVQAAIGWMEYQYDPEQCAACGMWGEHNCEAEEDDDVP